MKLRILASAEEEIRSARLYLDDQSPGLGARFISDLETALARILDRPLMFEKLESESGSKYRRALLKRFRYAVVFEVRDEELVVVAVAHTSRKPNYWVRRNQ